jgi:hypothetical protein
LSRSPGRGQTGAGESRPDGKFMREIGKNLDPHDNIWAVERAPTWW